MKAVDPIRRAILLGLAAAAVEARGADDPCGGFRWDVRRERALFGGSAQALRAGKNAAAAPLVQADQFYEFALSPQEQVDFAAPPGKKMLTDGAFAGLARFKPTVAGDYRVAIDGGFWIDVVDGKALIASKDFQGLPACTAPHKIVVYTLPWQGELILQFSGAAAQQVRFSVTAAAAPAGG